MIFTSVITFYTTKIYYLNLICLLSIPRSRTISVRLSFLSANFAAVCETVIRGDGKSTSKAKETLPSNRPVGISYRVFPPLAFK